MTLDLETAEQVRMIAAEIATRAAKEVVAAAPLSGLLKPSEVLQATVSSDLAPGGSGTIRFDGDIDSITDGAQNATGRYIVSGQRVVVMTRPTGGALIVGFVGRSLGWHVVDSIAELSATGIMQFLDVPQVFDALRVTAYIRVASANVNVDLSMRLNGDSSAIYDTDEVGANNAIAFGAQFVNGSRGVIACAPGSTATANNFASVQLLIPNCRGTGRRTWDSSGGWGQSGSMFTRKCSGIYRSVDPVSQIDIQDSTGNSPNMAAGSWAVLEGLVV